MPVNGRAKGQVFERELARTVSVWWTGNKDLEKVRAEELPFRRTPLSGGWDRKAAASDLLVVEPEALPCPWPFALEAKNQECWDWDGLFKNNAKWPVKAYWEQCCEAATKSKLHPLVLFTRKLQPIYFAMSPQAMDVLQIPHVSVTWLPFVIGKFDDLLALDPQQIVAFLGQVKLAGVIKGIDKAVKDFKDAGCKFAKASVVRAQLSKSPVQESKLFPGYLARGDEAPDMIVRDVNGVSIGIKGAVGPSGPRVAPIPESVPEPSRPIPTIRPMMLKCYHGKWRKVPVPKKYTESTPEKVLGTTWR